VLVKPNFGVSTAEAYSKLKMPLTKINKINKIISTLQFAVLEKDLSKELFFNSFENTVFADYPEIQKIKNVLNDLGATSLMSGSGATVFGLVSGKDEAKKIADTLKIYKWNVWIVKSFEINMP
jgi:4-diphosphocytidyl-2-C-methyl-D-erythritol kinase